MDIRCGKDCGFVVHETYFREKPRFQVPFCPRCGGIVSIVAHGTYTVVTGAYLEENRHSGDYGSVKISTGVIS
jgi:NAD-dependent SIR2 family protein deacetylase